MTKRREGIYFLGARAVGGTRKVSVVLICAHRDCDCLCSYLRKGIMSASSRGCGRAAWRLLRMYFSSLGGHTMLCGGWVCGRGGDALAVGLLVI